MGARTDAARAEVLAARQGLEDEVVRLEASARAAVDIPARLRREPAKVGGAALGAAFLLLGGPKRLFRGARQAIRGKEADLPKSMLPDEIETTLRKLGPGGDRVRAARSSASSPSSSTSAPPSARRATSWALAGGLLGNALRPASVRAGREFAERLFDPDGPSFAAGLRKARARMDGSPSDPPRANPPSK